MGQTSDIDSAGVAVDDESASFAMREAGQDAVVLADGTVQALDLLTRAELLALQWQEERAFARRIVAAPKGSAERGRVTCQAYDTVTRIFASLEGHEGQPLAMGVQPRYGRFILNLLRQQQRRGQTARFFEIGYGTGTLLKIVADAGFPIAGIEIAATLREQAVAHVGRQHASQLHCGPFLKCDAVTADGPWSLVYWNDVFEHIPPDEIADWLARIHEMLAPGGQLVTITPNWHGRPNDATADNCPPRTEAVGLHLKEYTLGEISGLLRRAGFARVATPLVVVPRQIVLCGNGLIGCKRLFEPCLEWLPFRLARLLCRGLGLSYTIATKA